MLRHWDAQTIASEILRRYNAKQPLHYTGVAAEYLSLLRAATRYFGTWEAAITFAGLDYAEIRLYKVWTRMRIIARIREHWEKGEDLSWCHVSLTLDPQLAGAATKKKHFGSWGRALEAAGLDYDLISRYIRWSDERILEKVREFHNGGRRMNAKKMEAEEIALLTAARRRFGSWPQALQAAGLQASEIVLRASFKGHTIFLPPTSHGKRSPSRDASSNAPVKTIKAKVKSAAAENAAAKSLNTKNPEHNASLIVATEKKPVSKTLAKPEKLSETLRNAKPLKVKKLSQPSLLAESATHANKRDKAGTAKAAITEKTKITKSAVPKLTTGAVKKRIAATPASPQLPKNAQPKAAITETKARVAANAKTKATKALVASALVAKALIAKAPAKNKKSVAKAVAKVVVAKLDKPKNEKVVAAKFVSKKPSAPKPQAKTSAGFVAQPKAKPKTPKIAVAESAVKAPATKSSIPKTPQNKTKPKVI